LFSVGSIKSPLLVRADMRNVNIEIGGCPHERNDKAGNLANRALNINAAQIVRNMIYREREALGCRQMGQKCE
jgi:hypothetical protein